MTELEKARASWKKGCDEGQIMPVLVALRECADALELSLIATTKLHEERDDARKQRDRLLFLAEHLFQTIPREVWRDQGVEWMGQYEGDRYAEETLEELQAIRKEVDGSV